MITGGKLVLGRSKTLTLKHLGLNCLYKELSLELVCFLKLNYFGKLFKFVQSINELF